MQRSTSDLLLATIDALVVVITPAGRLVRINLAAERISGFSSSEVFDRPIFSALLMAHEVSQFESALLSLAQTSVPQRLEGWTLVKNGDRRRIAWTYGVEKHSRRNKPTILCTGIDVTALHNVQTDLAEARKTADGHAQQLEKIRREVAWMESTPWSDGGPPAFMQIGDNSRSERRTAERRPYPYVQLLAPIVGSQRPAPDTFEKVLCHDISSGRVLVFPPRKHPRPKKSWPLSASPARLPTSRPKSFTVGTSPTSNMYLVGCRYSRPRRPLSDSPVGLLVQRMRFRFLSRFSPGPFPAASAS